MLIFCPEGGPRELHGGPGGGSAGDAASPLPGAEAGPAPSGGLRSAGAVRSRPGSCGESGGAGSGGDLVGAKTRGVPLVASYHTHLPKYLEYYGMGMLEPLLWELLKAAHNQAQLNLCTSTAMVEELSARGASSTPPSGNGGSTPICSARNCARTAMRERLHGGHDDTGHLLLYIGRLSAEKQIERIRPVLEAMPQARLALVGDGPHRQQLERIFEGTATTFVGYLAGEDLASRLRQRRCLPVPLQHRNPRPGAAGGDGGGLSGGGCQPRRHPRHRERRGQRLPLRSRPPRQPDLSG